MGLDRTLPWKGLALVLNLEWVELKVTLPAAQYTAATVLGTLFVLAAGRVAANRAAVVWVDSVVVTVNSSHPVY